MRAPQNGGRFVDVRTGRYSNICALRDDGAVECFGAEHASPLAVIVADVGFFSQLGGGYRHDCALRNDGVVQCWAGDPPGSDFAPPVRTATNGYFTQVEGGSSFTCGLRNDGVIECWGDILAVGLNPPPRTAQSAPS